MYITVSLVEIKSPNVCRINAASLIYCPLVVIFVQLWYMTCAGNLYWNLLSHWIFCWTYMILHVPILLDWSPVFILSRIKTASRCTIQEISLDTLLWSNITLRGSRASYQPRSKLNLPETERPVSDVRSTIIHELPPDGRSRVHYSWIRQTLKTWS